MSNSTRRAGTVVVGSASASAGSVGVASGSDTEPTRPAGVAAGSDTIPAGAGIALQATPAETSAKPTTTNRSLIPTAERMRANTLRNVACLTGGGADSRRVDFKIFTNDSNYGGDSFMSPSSQK